MYFKQIILLSVTTLLPLLLHADTTLVWSDEFDTPSIDLTKWSYEINCYGGGNSEQQCYVQSNTTLHIENGVAIFSPVYYPKGYQGQADGCTDNTQNSCTWTQPVTSARIRTLYSQSWKYGKFEFRAKLPIGNFLWPALWLLPTESVYGSWAASGEIDIMEFRGQASQLKIIENTVHYGGVYPDNTLTGSGPTKLPYNLTDDFHVFTLLWTQESIQWFVDDEETFQVSLNKSWWSNVGVNPYTGPYQPFDQEFYIIMNVAVAGNFFNGFGQFVPADDTKTWTSPFQIDYVRVYQNITTPIPNVPPGPPSWEAPLIIIIVVFVSVLIIATIVWWVRKSRNYFDIP